MSEAIKDAVRSGYGATARSADALDKDGAGRVAAAFGYSAEDLAGLPDGANLGLSCGNPIATASLKEGETVVDLGSGGGLDVFLAARRVGPTGAAIGIDMTEDMIALARRNAEKGGYENVVFHHAEIEALPLADATVDCIISNCVVNLSSDKPRVFREMFRVLKPGGRVAISDIAIKKPLPPELKDSLEAYVGCFAGALPMADFETGLAAAGFSHVAVIDDGSDLNAYGEIDGQAGCCAPAASETSCCAPASFGARGVHESLGDVLNRHDVNAYAASVKVYAVKPV